MKTILLVLTFVISMPIWAQQVKSEKNVKLPIYTSQNIQTRYVNDTENIYAYAQPYTLSSQISARKKILYVAVMQSAGENLYTTLDTDFVVSKDVAGEDRGHCLNYIGDGKGIEKDKSPNEFLYMFFEYNREQKKINFHKIILHEKDPAIRDKFDAINAICSNHLFELTTKIKIGKGPERQLQDILPELKRPVLQFDSAQLESGQKK